MGGPKKGHWGGALKGPFGWGPEKEEEQVFIANAKGRNGQESPYTQVFGNRDIRILKQRY